MTFRELSQLIDHYDKVIKTKRKSIYKYTLFERLVAKIMKRYYTSKWEHYFDL
jgi:hypothetical protein